MKEWIVGCDLGSSSVKVIRVNQDGAYKLSRKAYQHFPTDTVDIWETFSEAFKDCVFGLSDGQIKAISLTGQVGSYIFFDEICSSEAVPIFSWQQSDGKAALDDLLERFDRNFFMREISMPYPPLQSYPVPFLMSRKKLGIIENGNEKLLSVKDYLYYRLTGEFISDPYTWRGLCNQSGLYSETLLAFAEFSKDRLPVICDFNKAVHGICASAACTLGIRPDVPIYTGCNDFFAALLGSGSLNNDSYFDVTGTSEHFGMITDSECNSKLISSPFLGHNICYGVTASGGNCLAWAKKQFGSDVSDSCADLPIFLPYLNGERTPLYDGNARGVFWGLSTKHNAADLHRAVLEGIVFSLLHIKSLLPKYINKNKYQSIKISGGAGKNEFLNQLKANLFKLPVQICEPESTPLGTAMIAAVGEGWFSGYDEAAQRWVKMRTILPKPQTVDYKKRFENYLRISRMMGKYLSEAKERK